LLVATHLLLDRATFEQAILIEAASPQLLCINARFSEAATLRLRYADIAIDGTVFAKPSTISFARDDTFGQVGGHSEAELFGEAPLRHDGHALRPRLLSVRRVDVSNLVLADLNLALCLFAGAHRLDQLRIEGPPGLRHQPGDLAAAAWALAGVDLALDAPADAGRGACLARGTSRWCRWAIVSGAVDQVAVGPVELSGPGLDGWADR
jgi:hypothetical protein